MTVVASSAERHENAATPDRRAARRAPEPRRTAETMMYKISMIAVGGALGSVLRYAIQGCVQRAVGSSFPAGTLVVNLIGCAAIGFLAAALAGPWLVREEYRIG